VIKIWLSWATGKPRQSIYFQPHTPSAKHCLKPGFDEVTFLLNNFGAVVSGINILAVPEKHIYVLILIPVFYVFVSLKLNE